MKDVIKRMLRDPLYDRLGDGLVIMVDPRAITMYAPVGSLRGKVEKKKPAARLVNMIHRRNLVLPTGWIMETRPFSALPASVFLSELWAAQGDYTQTARYRDIMADLDAGRIVRMESKGYTITSTSDAARYFEDYVALLRSMAAEGYVAGRAVDDMLVMVGRDRKLVKESRGRHRFAAAQVVGVPSVPVRISHIHPDALAHYSGSVETRIRALVKDISNTYRQNSEERIATCQN